MRWLLVFVMAVATCLVWLLPMQDAKPFVVHEEARDPQTSRSERVDVETGTAPQPDQPSIAELRAAGVPHIVFEVMDREGFAVVGARVEALEQQVVLASAPTNEVGRAVLRAVEPTTAFHIAAVGYLQRVGQCDPEQDVQRVTLQRAPQLVGDVMAKGQGAIAGAKVALLPVRDGRCCQEVGEGDREYQTVTDEHGSFFLSWPGLEMFDLVVTAEGYAPQVLRAIDSRGTKMPVIWLHRGATLVGQISQANGAVDATGCRVEVWTAPTATVAPPSVLGSPAYWRHGQRVQTETIDRDGLFEFDDLPPGPAWAVLTGAVTGGAQLVELTAREPVSVTLQLPKLASVVGTTPRRDLAEVYLCGDRVRTAKVDGDGQFHFDGLPPGRYLLGEVSPTSGVSVREAIAQFEANGYAVGTVLLNVTSGARMEVDLSPTTTAAGGVIGEAFIAGRPARDYVVAADPVGGDASHRRAARIGAGGSYHLKDVAPGDYIIRLFDTNGGVSAERACRVVGGTAVWCAPLIP